MTTLPGGMFVIDFSSYPGQASTPSTPDWPQIIRDIKPHGVDLSDEECFAMFESAKASAEAIESRSGKAEAIANYLRRSKRLLKVERSRA